MTYFIFLQLADIQGAEFQIVGINVTSQNVNRLDLLLNILNKSVMMKHLSYFETITTLQNSKNLKI